MADLSNYLENELLDHCLGTGSFTMPSQVYVALYTSAPTDSGGGTQVSGGSYARQAVDFGAASSGSASPTADVEFPTATANWGTIVAVGLFDASTSGNLLWHKTLSPGKAVGNGDKVVIEVANLTVSLD